MYKTLHKASFILKRSKTNLQVLCMPHFTNFLCDYLILPHHIRLTESLGYPSILFNTQVWLNKTIDMYLYYSNTTLKCLK